MAVQPQTYVFVTTAAEFLGISTSEVMDLVDLGTLDNAEAEGMVLIDANSLATFAASQAVAV